VYNAEGPRIRALRVDDIGMTVDLLGVAVFEGARGSFRRCSDGGLPLYRDDHRTGLGVALPGEIERPCVLGDATARVRCARRTAGP
jgi:hypothetical protein